MASWERTTVRLYLRYPLWRVLTYNGTTILHYLLGGLGIFWGFRFWPTGYVLGAVYLLFAFGQMYIAMPLMVCPNCVYYRAEDARCISALNLVARRVAKAGNAEDFAKRAEGLLCHNNLYMASLVVPILAMIPALVVNFSPLLLATFLVVVGLLAFRIFVVFPKIACVHCAAKYQCPNALAMGLVESR